jgi:hypothetical protein
VDSGSILLRTSGISFAFQQSTTNPERLLLHGCWESKADHDDLDLRGVTPKMLQGLLSRISLPPIAVYYLSMEEEERKKVGFNAEVLGVTAWHVREGCKEEFQGDVEKKEMLGSWYVEKGVPLRPTVMPSDPEDVRMIEEGEKRALARLKMSVRDIWISFWKEGEGKKFDRFRDTEEFY